MFPLGVALQTPRIAQHRTARVASITARHNTVRKAHETRDKPRREGDFADSAGRPSELGKN